MGQSNRFCISFVVTSASTGRIWCHTYLLRLAPSKVCPHPLCFYARALFSPHLHLGEAAALIRKGSPRMARRSFVFFSDDATCKSKKLDCCFRCKRYSAYSGLISMRNISRTEGVPLRAEILGTWVKESNPSLVNIQNRFEKTKSKGPPGSHPQKCTHSLVTPAQCLHFAALQAGAFAAQHAPQKARHIDIR